MPRALTVVSALLLAIGASACADDAGSDSLTVFAAASLTDAFDEITAAFEDANPGVSVVANYAGSSSLREQILEGAPVDVFASANAGNMDDVVAAGEISSPVPFATNRLQIVVPVGNPAGITGLVDFDDQSLLVGLCAVEVPCGDFAREALDRAGVTPAPDTEEPDVRALLTKVEAGELDAGIVYRTDVLSAGDGVEGIDIPDGENVVVVYPLGVLESSGDPETARAFVEYVLGAEGQAVLRDQGFGPPP